MENQTLLSFEPASIAARGAAQAFLARAEAETQREEELAKMDRRWRRETVRRERVPDQVALCGFYFYNRSPHTRGNGNYWQNCFRCGKPLQYFDTYEEAQANKRECNGTATSTTALSEGI